MSYYKDFVLRIREEEEKYIFEELSFPFIKGKEPDIIFSDKSLYDKAKLELLITEFKLDLKNKIQEDIETAGKFLWNDFIPGEIKKRLLENIKEVEVKEKRYKLRLRLMIEPYELQYFPWEALYDDYKFSCLDDRFLALTQYISIVHLGNTDETRMKIAPLETLRVLLIGSSYGNEDKGVESIPTEEIEAELDRTEEILRETGVIVGRLKDPTSEELKNKIQEKEGWHIIHFFGHGLYSKGDPLEQSCIILKNGFLTAKELSETISDSITRLVFFASCSTALGFGYGLSISGVPAVIGMRYEISQDATKHCIKEFFTSISERNSIDIAVSKVRDKLRYNLYDQEASEWFTPVIFLSSQDSQLFESPEKVEVGNYLYFLIRNYAYTSISLGKHYPMDNFVLVKLKKELKEEIKEVNIFDEIQHNKHMLIKGKPGYGKSTLVKYISYKIAQSMANGNVETANVLPVYLPLNYWSSSKIGFMECIKKYYENSGVGETFFKELENLIRQGKCLLLLDGLDEVTEERVKFIDEIFKQFINGLGNRCTCIVTTRLIGYTNDLDTWESYEVNEFNMADINKFFKVYFRKDSKKFKLFANAIERNKQIKSLSHCPLILKLMCFIYGNTELGLNYRRAVLYENVINQLLKIYFEKRRKGIKEYELDDLIYSSKELLEKIALKFFLVSREVFSYDEIRNFLEKEEREILQRMPYESGLLQKVGEKYTFLHLTFQEYFTACALAKREDYLNIIEENLWDWERWEEIIIVLSSILQERAKDLINILLEHDDERDIAEICNNPVKNKDLWRNMLWIAAKCFRESELKNKKIENEIINRLEDINKNKYSIFRKEAIKSFGKMGTIEPVIQAIKDEDEIICWNAADTLSEIDSERSVKVLIQALKDKNERIRYTAVYALGKISSEKAIKTLIKELTDQSNLVRIYAADALNKISSEQSIQYIIQTLNEEDKAVYFSNLKPLNNKTVESINVIRKDKNEKVFSNNAHTLDKVVSEKLMDLICALKDENEKVRYSAIKALGEIGSEEIIEPLISVLNDENSKIRYAAANTLGKIGSEKAVEPLIESLNDKNKIFCYAVASALGEIGSNKAIKPLIQALREDHLCDLERRRLFNESKKLKKIKEENKSVIPTGYFIFPGLVKLEEYIEQSPNSILPILDNNFNIGTTLIKLGSIKGIIPIMNYLYTITDYYNKYRLIKSIEEISVNLRRKNKVLNPLN